MATVPARLEQADDCERLHVVAGPARADPAADRAMAHDRDLLADAGLGRLVDPDTAMLDVESLYARARAASSVADWDARWTAMLSYAEGKGWTSVDGRFVQAHVERVA